MNNETYDDYLEMLETSKKKKAKKKKLSKKEAKKLKTATKKLKQLAAVADEENIKSYTATGKPSKYTAAERSVFQARIQNEKKNIMRICNGDAQQILVFCNANKIDEKNFAVKYAREAASTWAVKMGAVDNITAPQLPF